MVFGEGYTAVGPVGYGIITVGPVGYGGAVGPVGYGIGAVLFLQYPCPLVAVPAM